MILNPLNALCLFGSVVDVNCVVLFVVPSLDEFWEALILVVSSPRLKTLFCP